MALLWFADISSEYWFRIPQQECAMQNNTAIAIPVFFIMMGLELLIARMQHPAWGAKHLIQNWS